MCGLWQTMRQLENSLCEAGYLAQLDEAGRRNSITPNRLRIPLNDSDLDASGNRIGPTALPCKNKRELENSRNNLTIHLCSSPKWTEHGHPVRIQMGLWVCKGKYCRHDGRNRGGGVR